MEMKEIQGPSPNVFISYCHSDRHFVRRLSDDLRAHKAEVWIDETEIRVGDLLLEKIQDGIGKAHFFLVVISSASVASDWVQRELAIAMDREATRKQVKVLPVVIERCSLPSFLVKIKYTDFREQYEIGLRELLETFRQEGYDAAVPGDLGVGIPFRILWKTLISELSRGFLWLCVLSLLALALFVLSSKWPGYWSTVSIIPFIVFLLVSWNFMAALGALSAGDDTSKYLGKLRFDPITHLDPIGLVAGTLLLGFFGIPLLWVKPIAIQPRRFLARITPQRAFARIACLPFLPLFLLILICSMLSRLCPSTTVANPKSMLILLSDIEPPSVMAFFLYNLPASALLLIGFNLIPAPPLNGSNLLPVLFGFDRGTELRHRIEQIGPLVVLPAFIAAIIFRGRIGQLAFWIICSMNDNTTLVSS